MRTPFTLEAKIIDAINTEGPMSAGDIRESLGEYGYDAKAVAAALRALLDKGLLRLGSGLTFEVAP